MIEFRISRDGEFVWRNPLPIRLYHPEPEELISLLNAGTGEGTQGLLRNLGPFSYGRKRERIGASINEAADNLMQVIRADLQRRGETELIENCIAFSLRTEAGPWVKKPVLEYVRGGNVQEDRTAWQELIFLILIRWAKRIQAKTPIGAHAPHADATSKRLLMIMQLLARDEDLAKCILNNRREMQRRGSDDFFARQRTGLDTLARERFLSQDSVNRELRALEILEKHSAALDLYLERLEQNSNWAVGVAVRIFDCWVNEKLKDQGLSFRLILDRLSTYRVVPVEACRKPDPADSSELRLVLPRTILSACLIAYLTQADVKTRVHDWVQAVDLIDHLAFAGALTRIVRCEVCGRWIYAFHSTRVYCDGACRYKVWAKTARGRQRRQKASAAYRRRFNDQVRKAAPNVRRGQRNH